MDRTRQMASFVAVVDTGSFVAAADASGVSKTAMSRQVAELEARLGVRLLHRTTRRLSLTGDGQLFYARCKEVLAAVDEAEAELTASTGEASGLVRIAVPLVFGTLHLAPLWGRFCDLHPKVDLALTLTDRLVDLVEDGFDLMMHSSLEIGATVVKRPFAPVRAMLCASPDYLARHGTPVHPAELAEHRTINYSLSEFGDVWTLTGAAGEISVRVRPRIRATSIDTCHRAALAHQGIAPVVDYQVYDDLRLGTLVELFPEYRFREREMYVAYASRRHLPVRSRAMIDFLVDAFRDPPWRRGPEREAARAPGPAP